MWAADAIGPVLAHAIFASIGVALAGCCLQMSPQHDSASQS
jgi:hypothetical protein